MKTIFKTQDSPYHITPPFDVELEQFNFDLEYTTFDPYVPLVEDTGKQLFKKHVRLSASGLVHHGDAPTPFACSFIETYSSNNIYVESYSNSFSVSEVYSCV